MYKLLQNKHFIDISAKVVMYCTTILVVGVLFWKAPEYAVQIMNAGAYMLGGVVVASKVGIKN